MNAVKLKLRSKPDIVPDEAMAGWYASAVQKLFLKGPVGDNLKLFVGYLDDKSPSYIVWDYELVFAVRDTLPDEFPINYSLVPLPADFHYIRPQEQEEFEGLV